MPTPDVPPADATDASLEQCIDDLDEFLAKLDHYPLTVLACALRVHLGGVLHALLDRGLLDRGQLRVWLVDLEREALRY